jgi:uncharacterized membrane protein YcaP (DUF421 family)
MDLLRIAARVIFAYAFLLLIVRQSGKRTLKHGSPFDFTVALVLGDILDDMVWGEVAAIEFVVAGATLFALHTLLASIRYRRGSFR